MITNIHKFRRKLAAGELCLGTGVTFNDAAVSEALANAVDFLWIDLEHNPIGMESLLTHLIAARAGGAPALVRVPGGEVSVLKRVLDSGAEGVIFPQVRSGEEVEHLVRSCRYPPKGTRGWGPRRPMNYGEGDFAEYMADVNERLFVCVQIEHVDAYRDLDRILDVEGLDSIVLGPNDLSGSMGKLCQLSDPEVVSAIESIVERARAAGLFVGTGMDLDPAAAVEFARLGIQWIQCGSDFGCMLRAAKETFREIRSRLA